MPWMCRIHKTKKFTEAKSTKPTCGQCGPKKDFVYWEDGTVEVVKAKLLKTGEGFNVYVEEHQGKHLVTGWPGYNEGKGDQFLTSVVTYANLSYLLTLWNSVEETVRAQKGTNGYCFFDVPEAVGTKGETYVVMQWGRVGTNFYIHAYPESTKRPKKTYI